MKNLEEIKLTLEEFAIERCSDTLEVESIEEPFYLLKNYYMHRNNKRFKYIKPNIKKISDYDSRSKRYFGKMSNFRFGFILPLNNFHYMYRYRIYDKLKRNNK